MKTVLMKAMVEHNYISKLTADLNQFFKYVVFIIYYMSTPSTELFIYIITDKETVFTVKIILTIAVLNSILAIFLITLMSSSISFAAKKSHSKMYKFLIENNFKFTVREKLKVQSFIEKLSGPDIGFYCLDWFPLNYFEFYIFCANCVKNYFLILNFV